MNYNFELQRPNEQTPRSIILKDGTYVIGRGLSSKILLSYPEVSDRHALLILAPGKILIEDLHSANGTYLNGTPISKVCEVKDTDQIQIGNCIMQVAPIVEGAASAAAVAPPPVAPAPIIEEDHGPTQQQLLHAEQMRQAKEQIQEELLVRLDIKRLTVNGINRSELEKQAREKIHEIVRQVARAGKLPKWISAERIEQEVFDEALRLGPLEALLADETVSEIMVNGPQRVYVERHGKLELTDLQFMDDESVMAIIERIVAPIGRRIDESQPYVDARLADGSRVNAIIPPLALSGPTVTIRKFSKKALTVDDFIRFGTWTHNAAEFMKVCVIMRKNIIVAGGTGSGKTTLLNLLSGFIPSSERIVTVEDAAELRLVQPHVVRLEARPPNIEGRGAVTIRDLVKNCLRMRPDRIIVGECRGGEALDMLQAMNTGHDGSLTTVHANSPRDVISRLETMVLMSGMELPSRAIREQISSAVDIIIHESRLSDGSRKVVAISEVMGLEGQQIVLQDIFQFRQSGVDEQGRVMGKFVATGAVPSFYEHLKARGLYLDPAVFNPTETRDINLQVIAR